MAFYYDLKIEIINVEEETLKAPEYNIEPNKDLDEKIINFLKKNYDNYATYPLDELSNLFHNEFWERVKKWITMHLNVLFLRYFYIHKTKFTPKTIEKLIDIGTRILINAGDPNRGLPMEDLISYFDESVRITEKVSFNLLILALIFDVSMYVYDTNSHYHNIVYWIDPSIFIPIEVIGYDKLFLESIPNILKEKLIPKGIFSDALQLKIKKFVAEFTEFKSEWMDTISHLFLHFAFFGFVNGKIPGIKEGVYTLKQFEQDLDKFLK